VKNDICQEIFLKNSSLPFDSIKYLPSSLGICRNGDRKAGTYFAVIQDNHLKHANVKMFLLHCWLGSVRRGILCVALLNLQVINSLITFTDNSSED